MKANGALILVVAHEGESEESLDKTYYVFLPPELCFVHPLPGSLVRGAQRLPSIMRRVESMLLAVQLKDIINYPVPSSKVLFWTSYCDSKIVCASPSHSFLPHVFLLFFSK